ncbi:TPA: hypothetical protein QHU25_002344 [Morganella morganii subsp. morganii]|uniref:DUF4440 domain-containing protein n=1 Tax=Morganella morganii TaxID=582 RepID=UPI00125ECB6A|nr:DUF4440 domain-containing protein [Morganella morganii]QLB48070.1 DUF4440 domain-containing protein [Morganella morganii]HDS5615796.1 hypothetical protein [Morganella morganii subsp. morganii]
MSNTMFQQACDEIHHVHDLIFKTFTVSGAEGQAALSELLTHFTPEFSMTGISGAVVDLAAVTAMFTRIQGQRQGAPIETAEYQCVSLTENTISVRYQETQHFAGSTTARRSLVILRREDNGKWLWHYLHETPLSA